MTPRMLYALLSPPLVSPLASLQQRPSIFRMSATSASTGNFEIDLFSPAKVNLFTRILQRYDDGCHEVASLHHAIGYGDRVLLARIPADRFAAAGVVRPSRTAEPIKQHAELSVTPASPDAESIPLDESNLIVRALALFRTRLAERDGGSLEVPRFRAHVVKRIPPDAGLGGAASNAATALWGANELCGRPASPAELAEWARELGSDVACFLIGEGGALCTGKAVFHKPTDVAAVSSLLEPGTGPGTATRAEAPLGQQQLLLITPVGCAPLSTPSVFRALKASSYESLSAAEPSALIAALRTQTAEGAESDHSSAYVNDLEAAALRCSAALDAIMRRLVDVDGIATAMLLGTGPSLVAIGESREKGDDLARRCRESLGGLGGELMVRPVRYVQRESDAWYVDEEGTDATE